MHRTTAAGSSPSLHICCIWSFSKLGKVKHYQNETKPLVEQAAQARSMTVTKKFRECILLQKSTVRICLSAFLHQVCYIPRLLEERRCTRRLHIIYRRYLKWRRVHGEHMDPVSRACKVSQYARAKTLDAGPLSAEHHTKRQAPPDDALDHSELL